MHEQGRRSCDLVMKGGITSGVVYPGAISVLGERHRFRNLGGASAGAIAAAVAAASEYGRLEQRRDDMPGLNDVARDLATPGFIAGLLDPNPGAEPAFAAFKRHRALRGRRGRGMRVALTLVRHRPLATVVAAIALAAALVGLVAALEDDEAVVAVLAAAALATLLAGAAFAGAAWQAARSLRRALEANEFGVCDGRRLTQWLHERIQACAGRSPDDPPLTFADLAAREVRLEVMTTDLALARPVRLPLEAEDEGRLRFDPDLMRRRFPARVVDAMGEGSFPTADLPVVVAVRMSLSFPFLLSGIELGSTDGGVRHLFSDGGISSNFPIHFFDSWLPGHPTFGLDLQRFPEGEFEEVFMPGSDERPVPHANAVRDVGGFVRQIVDVGENWRDTTQAELPGFRDRVCQVRLHEHEGGLNLEMDERVIAGLIVRGRKAAEEIESKFDLRRHRWTRYLTAMEQLEEGLKLMASRFEEFGADLAAGMPGVDAYRAGHDEEWCRAAHEASRRLLELAAEWGPPPAEVGFDRGFEPLPRPVMRVTPRA